MTDARLIAEHNRIKEQYDDICREVERRFLPRVTKAIEQGNFGRAERIAQTIPDHVSKCIAYEAIKHARS